MAVPKTLFLTHVGAAGGAEFKMLSICPHISGAEVMTFQQGDLIDRFALLNIPVTVCEMPQDMEQVRRENGLASIVKAVPAVLRMIRNVARHCRKYDVLVPMSQKSFMIASLAKPFVRKPIIWYMNDLINGQHFSRVLMRILILISRFSANHIIFNSQASWENWVAAGGREKNTSISFSGIDVDAFDEQLRDKEKRQELKKHFSPDEKPLIGIFGRLSPWKGQDVFLHALAKIDSARGVIVGDALFGETQFVENLEKLSIQLGVNERVTFAGHRDDIANVMAACDAVVHCSTAPEPFGRVIVEAMLARTPVIASNAGGAKEIVIHGETGLLTEPGDEQQLGAAIESYLNNPEWAQKLAESGRERAEKCFSSTAMIQQFKEILQGI